MADLPWEGVVAKLGEAGFGKIANILYASVPEYQDNLLVLRIPGGIFQKFVPFRQLGDELKKIYAVTDVSIIPDDALGKKLTEAGRAMKHEDAAGPQQSVLAAVYAPTRPVDFHPQSFFSDGDYLSEKCNPGVNPFVVTDASRIAYDQCMARIASFPRSPQKDPLLIYAHRGQGKTHLLQHLAWTLKRKIGCAHLLRETKDYAAAREEFSAPDLDDQKLDDLLHRAETTHIRYISSEELMREHSKIVKESWPDEERENAERYKREREQFYEHVHYLFLDDLTSHVTGERGGTVHWTYGVVDRAILRGDVVISASDTNPRDLISEKKDSEIGDRVQRLMERLSAGGIVDIALLSENDRLSQFIERMRRAGFDGGRVTPELLQKYDFGHRVWTYRHIVEAAETAIMKASGGFTIEDAIAKSLATFPPMFFYAPAGTEFKKGKKKKDSQLKLPEQS